MISSPAAATGCGACQCAGVVFAATSGVLQSQTPVIVCKLRLYKILLLVSMRFYSNPLAPQAPVRVLEHFLKLHNTTLIVLPKMDLLGPT
jgi:hypothetical protein